MGKAQFGDQNRSTLSLSGESENSSNYTTTNRESYVPTRPERPQRSTGKGNESHLVLSPEKEKQEVNTFERKHQYGVDQYSFDQLKPSDIRADKSEFRDKKVESGVVLGTDEGGASLRSTNQDYGTTEKVERPAKQTPKEHGYNIITCESSPSKNKSNDDEQPSETDHYDPDRQSYDIITGKASQKHEQRSYNKTRPKNGEERLIPSNKNSGPF
eukprot:gb/GECH01011483.1/.p1 GENE.gb/GECH01011483.1/~~gb/GECH01011483.1/.p1  ORF type:complete len:214 (+),score=63.04 gb/GECH01011483.1/:1-642(+)